MSDETSPSPDSEDPPAESHPPLSSDADHSEDDPGGTDSLETLPLSRAPYVGIEQHPDVPDSGLSGSRMFANYHVISRLDRGGMGEVFKAQQQNPKRTVALKVMLQSGLASRESRARFEREAAAIALLSHPYIVPIYESGEADDGTLFYTMELVDGEPLERFVNNRQMATEGVLELFGKVCEGVHAAHQRGVIHRDLKPANVMVDARGNPRLLDFGLAKLSVDGGEELAELSRTGCVMGSLPYMAPEQTLGDSSEIDTRTDVYALGVILFKLLIGEFPYDVSGNQFGVAHRIRFAEPQRPRTASSRISTDLEAIMLKALEKEKPRRYQSAEALGADIGRYLAGAPIEARRATAMYQLRKLAYRHRRILLSVAAVVLVAAAVAGYSFQRVRAERRDALEAKDTAEAAEAAAELDRQTALTAKTAAELESYFAGISLAQMKVSEGDFGGAESLLDRSPPELREWEWGRLKYLCHPEIFTLTGHTGYINSVAFSPDGKRIASGSDDETIKVWDASSRREVMTLKGHTSRLNSVAFSPDGKRLVSGSDDETIKIWDASSGREVMTLTGHTVDVNSVAFSPDGQRIASGSGKTIKVWDASSGREVMMMTLRGSVPGSVPSPSLPTASGLPLEAVTRR